MKEKKVLEKNEFLIGLEALFKKYNCTKAWVAERFDGTKAPGLTFIVLCSDYTRECVIELNEYVDYTFGKKDDEYEMSECGVAFVGPNVGLDDKRLIYEDGVFYAN